MVLVQPQKRALAACLQSSPLGALRDGRTGLGLQICLCHPGSQAYQHHEASPHASTKEARVSVEHSATTGCT